VIAAQAARIVELERRLGADSSTSSKPPSSDSPYRKPTRRSERGVSGRKPGKQPGGPGATMGLVDDPDETLRCDLECCANCGADLSGAAITGVTPRQVTDVRPPPRPWVREYQIITRACPGCAAPAPHRRAHPPGRPMGPRCWLGRRSCCAPITCRWPGRAG
jgi:transposase